MLAKYPPPPSAREENQRLSQCHGTKRELGLTEQIHHACRGLNRPCGLDNYRKCTAVVAFSGRHISPGVHVDISDARG